MAELLKPDICVIGGGAGGLSVAATAAAFGVQVVLVERGKMGGDCLNVGCVPSKSLIAAARRARAIAQAHLYGLDARVSAVDFARVRAHVRGVIAAIAPNDSKERYTGLGVRVIEGTGKFLDPRTLAVGDGIRIKARRFVIATGSAPALPPIPGLASTPHLTNETVFDLDQCPGHLVVIGAGAVGLELAQTFRRLGAEVTVLEAEEALVHEDPECVRIVLAALEREGIAIRRGVKIAQIMEMNQEHSGEQAAAPMVEVPSDATPATAGPAAEAQLVEIQAGEMRSAEMAALTTPVSETLVMEGQAGEAPSRERRSADALASEIRPEEAPMVEAQADQILSGDTPLPDVQHDEPQSAEMQSFDTEADEPQPRNAPWRLRVVLAGAEGKETIAASHILVATGRRPSIDGLGLEAARIKYEPQGIVVDSHLMTTNKRVYAIGDVTGAPQFTHAANYHAGLVIRNALFRQRMRVNQDAIPRVTFTDPELARAGLTETQARSRGHSIRVLRWPFHENDRAQAEHETAGHIKIVTDGKGRILGATIVGASAGELIATWALAISQNLNIQAFAGMILPYPTLAEVGKRAAMSYFTPRLTRPFVRRIIAALRRFG